MSDNGNGILLINRKLCPAGLRNNPNKALTAIRAVVIHTTANRQPTATAKSHATYQFNGSEGREASWHYTVDDMEIWQSFNDNQMTWHCGNESGNATTIGIEICVNAGAEKFKVACRLAAKLTAELVRKYKLTISDVKQHYDYAKKDCPVELRSGEWGITWADFITLVKDHLTALDEMLSFGVATKTLIMGKSAATAEQLDAYAKTGNSAAPSYAAIYIEEGNVEGVRGDLAFCQALHETGFFKFGGDVLPTQNNFAGLGATGGGVRGLFFPTCREGIRAQIQHLKAYASKEPLVSVCVDPRFSLVSRGVAPNWEDLDNKWAMTNGYGTNIVKLWNAAKNVTLPKLPEMTAVDAIAELVRFGIIQTPEYWLENVKLIKFLDALLVKTAKKLLELDSKY